MSSIVIFAQRGSVTGVVKDNFGQAIIGANVSVELVGTITDLDGNFKLEVPAGPQNVVVSYVGYGTKTIPILVTSGGTTSINVELM